MFSFAALSFLRVFHRRYATAATTIAPTPAPAPIPALAPVESPEGVSDGADVFSAELIGADVSLVVVPGADIEVVVDGILVVVAGAVVDLGSVSNTVPTTAYSVAFRSQVAQISGSDGSTLNLPTPLLQQFGLWSQQYDVSLSVTFEQDIKSVPPVSAPSSC